MQIITNSFTQKFQIQTELFLQKFEDRLDQKVSKQELQESLTKRALKQDHEKSIGFLQTKI